MTRAARPLRALAATAAIGITLIAGPVGAAGASGTTHEATPAGAVLDGQTAALDPGGTFDLALDLAGLPPTATITATVHDRVRSRSELASTTTGTGLRRAAYTVTVPAASLPADAGGSHHLAIPLTPGSPAGAAISTPGVYPVEVAATNDGAPISSFTTDLILRPPASAATVPLDVAVLAEVDAAPRSAEHPQEDARTIAEARALVAAVAATPDVVSTLAVRPELLEALAASSQPEAAALVTALQGVAAVQPVLALPYVATSPDGLAGAGIATELPHLIDRGTDVLRRVLGTAPRETTWLADPGLGGPGLALLSALGVGHAIVDPTRVDPVADGVLTPARPFQLAAPRTSGRAGRSTTTTTTLAGGAAKAGETGVEALLTDPRLTARLAEDAPPALVASRVLADLAVLAFEQPSTPRAVILPIADTIDAGAVRQVLAGLRSPTLFHPVALDQAFTAAAPLRAGDGTPVRRSLRPGPAMALPGSLPADITALRSQRDSVQGMVGATSPVLATVDGDLLRSMALGLATTERRSELAAGSAAIQRLASGIQTPPRFTITLTARDGTVPLTIRNDTGGTVTVLVHLHSPKLDLPGGATIPVTITGPSTRLDIAVRTRASGSFPFEAEVTSPDGRVALSSTQYSVRSTAVSGVGLVLSAGAGLFLVVWWARHWREARRSAKLVGSAHPVVAGPRHRADGHQK